MRYNHATNHLASWIKPSFGLKDSAARRPSSPNVSLIANDEDGGPLRERGEREGRAIDRWASKRKCPQQTDRQTE